MEKERRAAFVGIDVAIAKTKRLPIVACVQEREGLHAYALRKLLSAQPPKGHGNATAFDANAVRAFANKTLQYLREIEAALNVSIERIAIDAPKAPRAEDLETRCCELALGKLGISYFKTPSAAAFEMIRTQVADHRASGGSDATLPYANKLWMLTGFQLFRTLGKYYECIEVYPQACVWALNNGQPQLHKSKSKGWFDQLTQLSKRIGWPPNPSKSCLDDICYGSRHDKLDALLAAWVASLPADKRIALGKAPDDAIWLPAGLNLVPTCSA